jgi:hypothetical protein
MTKQFKLDSESALLDPDFHDGLLRGILTDRNSTLFLTCTDGNREQEYVLKVPEIHLLVVNNFRQGNIIFNIHLFSGEKSPREVILQATDLVDAEDQRPVDAVEAQIRENNWVTIHIPTSYGGELFAISKCSLNSIEIETLNQQTHAIIQKANSTSR